MLRKVKRPSPAMVIALIALFVALGGTAGAVSYIVPLAARAKNSDRLQGKTAAQVAAMPSPASTAKGLVSVVTSNGVLTPGQINVFTVSCPAGKKIINGAWTQGPGGITQSGGDGPTSDTQWAFLLGNIGAGASSITLYGICLG